MRKVGGSWTVGTKDNTVVYLSRSDTNGDLIFEANLNPGEAREIGAALIAKADFLEKAE